MKLWLILANFSYAKSENTHNIHTDIYIHITHTHTHNYSLTHTQLKQYNKHSKLLKNTITNIYKLTSITTPTLLLASMTIEEKIE